MHTILLGAVPAFLKLLLSAKLVCVIACVLCVSVYLPLKVLTIGGVIIVKVGLAYMGMHLSKLSLQ